MYMAKSQQIESVAANILDDDKLSLYKPDPHSSGSLELQLLLISNNSDMIKKAR